MNPAKFFLENHKFTVILTLLIVVFGLGGMKNLNSESYPTVDFAMAMITTSYDGASADEIESRITKPIEEEIRSVSDLKDVRSVSQAGKSSIFVRADIDNVNVQKFMADLQRAVDRVSDLPSDLRDKPKFTEMKSEEFPVVEMAIIGSNKDRARDKIADLLKESLEDNKSVLRVTLTGFRKRLFRVKLYKEKLDRYHIGINEVINKISARNVNIPGGHLKTESKQTLLRLEGKIKDAKELGNIVLRSNFSGQKIFVKDVADVLDDEEDPRVNALYNGEKATLLVVTKKGGADTLALVDSMDKTIKSFKESYPDYRFDIYANEALKVKNRLEVLTSNAVSGLVLVIVFLLIFLPGRIGLMASLSLPIAVLVTFGFMPLLGMNLNAVTILALVIALGMLVDNSVVISENYARLRKEGMGSKEAALDSISKLWLPITCTAMTTGAAFLPMLVTRGIMGQFIKWIPIVVCIALFASLIESFFFLPMRLVTRKKESKKKQEKRKKDDWFSRIFIRKFESFMSFVVKHRYLTSLIFMGLIVGSFYMMFVMNKFILFPSEQTEAYFARVEAVRGSPIEHTEKLMKELSYNIQKDMGKHIKSLISQVGISQNGPGDPQSKVGDDVGLLKINVDKYARDNIQAADYLVDLRKVTVPKGLKVTYEGLVNGPPVGQAINATIRSHNADNLAKAAENIVARVSSEKGVRNVNTDDIFEEDRLYIDVDEEKAARLGLTTREVGQIIRNGISGRVVSNVNLDNKRVDIKVQIHESARRLSKDISSIKVMDRLGNLVPISSVASFRQKQGSPQIKRFDFKRSKTITGYIDENLTTSVLANKALVAAYEKEKEKYPDLSIVFGGEEESTKESMDSLFDALILSLIGIFALLVFLFKSYTRPAIIMSTIPLGMIGSSVAFYLHQRPISFLALVGVIGLGGIIVNSGIILISFIDELKDNPENNFTLNEVLVKASGLRLRAVVVSSLTTISGLLPTAYGIGGSDAILIPMTLAMAWGLTSGTLLTLIWVPPAYGILEDFSGLFKRKSLKRLHDEKVKEASKEEKES